VPGGELAAGTPLGADGDGDLPAHCDGAAISAAVWASRSRGGPRAGGRVRRQPVGVEPGPRRHHGAEPGHRPGRLVRGRRPGGIGRATGPANRAADGDRTGTAGHPRRAPGDSGAVADALAPRRRPASHGEGADRSGDRAG